LRELTRLQTFPDDFIFFGSRHQIRAQIGEAVPPLAAKRIAEVVKDLLKAY
jgi:DNA (cytosine-5)-methyltransferase 1